MTFIETPRFPTSVAFGAKGGPRFKTRVVTLASGFEQRNIDWTEVRAEYDVSHGLKTVAQTKELLAFFLGVRGRAYGFRFKDHKDFDATSTEGIASLVTTVSPNQWQMYKRYTFGAITFDRRINKPVEGTVTVYKNGVEVAASIDYTAGRINIVGATGSDSITWDGEFDIPVRFDTDAFDGSFDEQDAVSWDNIRLVELKFA